MSNQSSSKSSSHSSRGEDEKGLFLPEHLEKQINQVYNQVKGNVQDLLDAGLNSATVLDLTERVMRVVGKLKDLVGYEKKVVVLSVVGKFVEESVKDLNEKAEELSDAVVAELNDLRIVVDQALSPYIDQVYSLAPTLYGKTKRKLVLLKKLVPCL